MALNSVALVLDLAAIAVGDEFISPVSVGKALYRGWNDAQLFNTVNTAVGSMVSGGQIIENGLALDASTFKRIVSVVAPFNPYVSIINDIDGIHDGLVGGTP